MVKNNFSYILVFFIRYSDVTGFLALIFMFGVKIRLNVTVKFTIAMEASFSVKIYDASDKRISSSREDERF
jgi:hypothetical protein